MHYKVVHVAEVTQEMEQAASDANSLFGNWPAIIRAAIHESPDTGMVAVRRDDLEKAINCARNKVGLEPEWMQRLIEALGAGVM